MAARRPVSNCAQPVEVTAIQTAVVQQELMDAALGCGPTALENFNAFQTTFGSELRRSDKTLLTMFRRIHGGSRGDAAYNLFKTDMASKAEIHRVRAMTDFCAAANVVFAAALAPQKPALSDFVSGIQITDENNDTRPVASCDIRVALTLKGTEATPTIVPKPNPMRVAQVAPPPPPPPVVAPVPEAQPVPDKKEEKKKSGWLSGIF
jgi:hypothetical protein